MKHRRKAIALMTGLLLLAGLAAWSQEAPAKPTLFVVYQDVVKPGLVEVYESAGRDMLTLMKAEKLDSPSFDFTAFGCTDMTYTYVTPMTSFASLDSMHSDWMKMETGADKDKWEALDKRLGETTVLSSRFFVMELADCDYIPKQPRLKAEDTKYRRLEFFYVYSGKEDEVRKAGKALAAACAKAGVTETWRVYEAIAGQEMPLFIVVSLAKDPTDFLVTDAATMKALGDEGRSLLGQIMSDTRRYEAKDVWVKPELSYQSPSSAAGKSGK